MDTKELSPHLTIQAQEQGTIERLESVQDSLGRMASGQVVLPDRGINKLVDQIPGWSYSARKGTDTTDRFLIRHIDTGEEQEELLANPPEPAVLERDGSMVFIVADEITNGVLNHVIEAEKEIRRRAVDANTRKEEIQQQTEKNPYYKDSKVEKIDKAGKLNEILTPREIVLLNYLPLYPDQETAARMIGVSNSTLTRVKKPLMDRLGLEEDNDLALASLSIGAVDINVFQEGKTHSLNETHSSYIENYFSHNLWIRNHTRHQIPRTTSGPRWFRAIKQAGVSSRRELVMSAARDELIKPPNREMLWQKLK